MQRGGGGADVSAARVEVNGTLLTEAQAMTLRVACTVFLEQLASSPDLIGSGRA